jgi:16S rRNA (uracil1498-N3)-methyltransferase
MTRTRSATRLYIPDAIPAHGVLDTSLEQAHHMIHVLRLEPGDAVTVFDGRGMEYDATIDRVTRSRVSVKVAPGRMVSRESPLSVTLAQGISSGERMDYTIQKAVELGARELQPIAAERSVVRLTSERATRRVSHWQAIAAAACEQCGRNVVPRVLPVASLTTWLASLPQETLRLTLSPEGPVALREVVPAVNRAVLLVGPEGGLSARERDDAKIAGFTGVRLGPRVLRTETAAVAALAAMQVLWGDF